jgi:8-oxo-dGTP pyrophosphatase MutT (NUDIX family)
MLTRNRPEKGMDLHRLRRALEPLIRPLMHFYWRLSRGATLGARGMVIDAAGRVFLVKHSYVDGWHLPGGGVETGETMLTALARELAEEGNIEVTGVPVLHGVFFNARVSRRDHVALYIVRDFRQDTAPTPDREIIAHGFFAPNDLPSDTGRATRARIAEVLDGVPVSELW